MENIDEFVDSFKQQPVTRGWTIIPDPQNASIDYDTDCESELDDDVESDDPDFDVSMTEDEDKDVKKEIYPIEKRKEIADYWYNNGNRRKLSSVQARYKMVTSIGLLRKWWQRLYGIEGTYILYPIHFLISFPFNKTSCFIWNFIMVSSNKWKRLQRNSTKQITG